VLSQFSSQRVSFWVCRMLFSGVATSRHDVATRQHVFSPQLAISSLNTSALLSRAS